MNVWVYFLLAKTINRIKIGQTRNLEQRIRNLTTASPELLGVISDQCATESQLHKMFAKDRAQEHKLKLAEKKPLLPTEYKAEHLNRLGALEMKRLMQQFDLDSITRRLLNRTPKAEHWVERRGISE